MLRRAPLVVLALLALAALASARTETRPYTGTGDAVTLCYAALPSGDMHIDAGGSCFVVVGASTATVSVDDARDLGGHDLAFFLYFEDGAQNVVGGFTEHCNTGTRTVPPSADLLFVSPTALGVLDCHDGAVPMDGTITATIN